MKRSKNDLRIIFDGSDGRCHICFKKIAFSNYGKHGRRGAWSVDHSRARALGGTDHGNNLRPACMSCNSRKSDKPARTARGAAGFSKPPKSKTQRARARTGNTTAGAVLGGIVGGAMGGPVGVLLGSALGGVLGHSVDPED